MRIFFLLRLLWNVNDVPHANVSYKQTYVAPKGFAINAIVVEL